MVARLLTSGGHVEVVDVSGDAVLRTSGCLIQAKNAGGRVMAETSGGSVGDAVASARGNTRGDLETSGPARFT